MSLLEGDIANLVFDGLEAAGLPYAVTLIREIAGSTEDPFAPYDPGPPTIVTYPCRGFVDDYSARQRDGTIIQVDDRKVVVLAPSLSTTPVPGDKVTAQGLTYAVISVKRDPAAATYELQVRGGWIREAL